MAIKGQSDAAYRTIKMMNVIMTSPPIAESQMGETGSVVAGFKGWRRCGESCCSSSSSSQLSR